MFSHWKKPQGIIRFLFPATTEEIISASFFPQYLFQEYLLSQAMQ